MWKSPATTNGGASQDRRYGIHSGGEHQGPGALSVGRYPARALPVSGLHASRSPTWHRQEAVGHLVPWSRGVGESAVLAGWSLSPALAFRLVENPQPLEHVHQLRQEAFQHVAHTGRQM